MNRRTYLGACAGAGLVGLSGCLDGVASQVTRTEAEPAILQWSDGDCDDGDVCARPHLIRGNGEEIGVDSGGPLGRLQIRVWLTGTQLRAQDYNSSRSNKPSTQSPDDGSGDTDSDDDGMSDGDETRVNNHNTTRSNRTNPVRDEGDGSDEAIDMEQAFDYLDDDDDGDGVVVGEVFVVTVPVVDLPGVADPASEIDAADFVTNMLRGARSTAPTSEETVLRNLTTPTMLRDGRKDQTTPLLYQRLSAPEDDDDPLAGKWQETRLRGETSAPDQSEPIAGRAVATLEGGVKLPVLVWTQHLVHEKDHLFVAGWVLDEARLYGNAATVLTASKRTDVSGFPFEPSKDPVAVRNAAGEEPCPDDRCGPEKGVLEAARDARRPDTESGDSDWMGLFIVSMDAPLVHGRRIIREVGVKK